MTRIPLAADRTPGRPGAHEPRPAPVAEVAWSWVPDQVRYDEAGPWMPTSVEESRGEDPGEPPWDRDGLHSGIGGLALAALGAGAEEAVRRLLAPAAEDRWPQTVCVPPRYLTGARIPDVTLGTAGVLLPGPLRHRAAARPDAEPLSRPRLIAAALAVAGADLGRPDLVAVATRGAKHLVTLADIATEGFAVPRTVPHSGDHDGLTWNRALTHDGRARWRFVEHRAEDPLLPPGTGWMQGATGIAGHLAQRA